MAADQQKKRINASSLVGCTSREQYRVKTKELRGQQHDLNMRPNISLEWDNKKQSVVSKREQIGISRRHLIPFIEPRPHGHSILADVFSVPAEIFELENLSEVLSYEVWQSHLSENERSFLSQFLPKEAKPDTIVRELLAGNNFHFGNPLSKWGTSLCHGDAHPDNVRREEQALKAGRKAYYSDLQEYHNDMIRNLQMWKGKWASCKDPEVEVLQNIWRYGKRAYKSMPLSEGRLCDSEENYTATPESCSWANSEKAYSSDNQNLEMVYGQLKRRECLSNNDATSIGRPKKREKLHKQNIQQCDRAKYMSYIKVSKQQHERVKSSLKHAGNSIPPRSLNNVLGSIDSQKIQPFERFEEEERKKLNEHWLKLVTKDIPGAFANREKRRFQKQQLTVSLGEEVEQKLECLKVTLDEGQEASTDKHMKLSDNSEKEILHSITTESVEKEQSVDLLQEQMDNVEMIHEMTTKAEDEKEIENDFIYEEQGHDTETIADEDESENIFQEHNNQQFAQLNNSTSSTMLTPPIPRLFGDQHQQIIGSINIDQHTNSMEMESCGNSPSARPDEHPPAISEYPVNLNHVDIPITQGDRVRSASGIWPAGGAPSSYYQSTVANASTQELSIGHPQFIHEPVRILGLETDGQEKDAGKNMQRRQNDEMSFLCSYPNQDRNGLLQSFFKGQGDLPYYHQPKHSGLEFHPGKDLMVEAGQFPGHFREQVHASLALDLRQKRLNDLYMHQNIQESMHFGGRYGLTGEDHLAVNIHDWANVNCVRMPAAHSQPPLNNVEMSRDWYAAESGATDVWPSFEVSAGARNNNRSSGSNSDQTLFSVLTECNGLQAGTSYVPVGPTERFIQAGSYSGMGGGIPSSSGFRQQSPNPLHYLIGPDAASAGLKMNSLGWMGMPQQNSGIPDTISKPFLTSWNQ